MMATKEIGSAVRALDESAHPIRGHDDDFAPVLRRAAHASVVLIGEASHGTHEFYEARAAITRRLIAEHGFSAVAVEADWPDAYRASRWVRGEGDDASAAASLADFVRFPRWMWRNTEVVRFLEWLREHNAEREPGSRVGFYGLDLYSLHASIAKVLAYLDVVDPEAARRARARYACFDHYGGDPQSYGYAASLALSPPCERDVVQQLIELRHRAAEYLRRDGRLAADAQFFAEQNALLVRNAEAYYRSMFFGRVASWNLRDRHMGETLEALTAHLKGRGVAPKIIVWAHNSHLGDARATQMGASGELNLGQLARERYEDAALLVGFSTYTGTVTAADDWGEPARRMTVRRALPESYEALLHDVAEPDFVLDLGKDDDASHVLRRERLERAIGVIYRPETERWSHYFTACLPRQFDLVLHYDRTRALHPLDDTAGWAGGEDLPETYPEGM
jgi:erythromycin esterase-like protein